AAGFPNGVFAPEAASLRLEALVVSGRHAEALAALGSVPAGSELSVLRGELRAGLGLCREALADFESALAPKGELRERALYGHAACRARLGDEAGARKDLERYLVDYPSGRFAATSRRALGSP